MSKIRWGIIGCGDVTEIKSGPAFSKAPDSSLVAVMRRDASKAEDYARRHQVPKWYSDARQLINDPDVNAIYVATPPSTHEEFAIAALAAGKPVYVEKPMSVNAAAAARMTEASRHFKQKLVVAHYRRAQPLFRTIKKLIDERTIGDTRVVHLDMYKKLFTETDLLEQGKAWRVNSEIAGGGIFHDLAPHQLDILYYLYGEPRMISAIATNQAKRYGADDVVAGSILFQQGVVFNGVWCFSSSSAGERDQCEITGDKGVIRFSFFDHEPIEIIREGNTETLHFDRLQHVQQPMIERVVHYFLGEGPNPCSGEEGVAVMKMIDAFTSYSPSPVHRSLSL